MMGDPELKRSALRRLTEIRAELAAHPTCDEPEECDTEAELRSQAIYCIFEAVMEGDAGIDELTDAADMSVHDLVENLMEGLRYRHAVVDWSWRESYRSLA
jgi:hypothetical protein